MDHVPESADDDGTTPTPRTENMCVWEAQKDEDDCSKSIASSCGSSRSVASLRVMDNEAELLALEEQRRFAAREADLEARAVELEKRRIETDLKQLRLEKDIAATKAKLQVYQNYERAEMEEAFLVSGRPSRNANVAPTFGCESSIGFGSMANNNIHRGQLQMADGRRKVEIPIGDQPRVPPGMTKSAGLEDPAAVLEVAGSSVSPAEMVQSLNETMKRSQLPKLKLSVFDGDALEFQQWLVAFERIIEQNTNGSQVTLFDTIYVREC